MSIDVGGNLGAGPLLSNTANNDYHLNIGSPVINSGANSFYDPGMITDISSFMDDLGSAARIL